jgi:ketosteroid isomerase-like protein
MEQGNDIRRANAALIEHFWQALTRGRRDELEAVFAEDATWHFPPLYRATRGIEDARGRDEVVAVFTSTPDRFYRRGTPRLERQFMLVDEAHAAIQFEMRATTIHGGDYFNRYVFSFRIAGGRIAEGWEHLDSAYFDWQMQRTS